MNEHLFTIPESTPDELTRARSRHLKAEDAVNALPPNAVEAVTEYILAKRMLEAAERAATKR
jgi:hypothetical protein